ncbi:hypothetical protein [Azospirillum humicireducens]|nr:hypothetical protein [Azospirillum humicireducens]
MRLTLFVFAVVWSLALLAFLILNPIVQGAGTPTPPSLQRPVAP